MAKLTVAGRKLLVDRILIEGWPPARAAEAQGCSLPTAYKWLHRFLSEGLAGLEDRSSRPHSSPRRLSDELEKRIIDLRNASLAGPHQIGWALGVAPSTVHKVLVRHRAPRLCDIDRATRIVVRYQKDRPGELVHIDIKKQGRIPDGGGWRVLGKPAGRRNSLSYRTRSGGQRVSSLGYDFIHAAVDDCSRIAFVEAHPDELQSTAVGFTQRAVEFFASLGIEVECVMTDGGACYRSKQFAKLLDALGIGHKFTRPYRPQTNGKVERFNLTLKNGWAYARSYASNEARLDELAVWLHHYNHHRPHMALNGQTPMGSINNVCGNHS